MEEYAVFTPRIRIAVARQALAALRILAGLEAWASTWRKNEIDGLEEIDSGVEISGNSLCRIGGIIEEMGFMIIGIVLK